MSFLTVCAIQKIARPQINIWYIVAALAGFTLLQAFYQASKQYTTIPYSQFETLLDQDKIDKVWIEQNTIKGTLKTPENGLQAVRHHPGHSRPRGRAGQAPRHLFR